MLIAPTMVLLAAIADPRIAPLLERVSEEAHVFAQRSSRFIGVETLTQRGRIAPPRFRLRKGANAAETPALAYRTTKLVSEYGFSVLKEAQGELREVRSVVSVNGRAVKDRRQARLELAEGMTGDMDRVNKQMLLDLEAYGLVGAATDLGQMLMLFNRAKLPEFEFTMLPDTVLENEPVAVLGYRQNAGGAASVYHGREVARVPMSGEIWIQRGTGQPVRITAEMPLKEGKYAVIHRIAVDYALSPLGVLLPSRSSYSRQQDSLLLVETQATYTDFKMFSAEAEIKFLAEGDKEQ